MLDLPATMASFHKLLYRGHDLSRTDRQVMHQGHVGLELVYQALLQLQSLFTQAQVS